MSCKESKHCLIFKLLSLMNSLFFNIRMVKRVAGGILDISLFTTHYIYAQDAVPGPHIFNMIKTCYGCPREYYVDVEQHRKSSKSLKKIHPIIQYLKVKFVY